MLRSNITMYMLTSSWHNTGVTYIGSELMLRPNSIAMQVELHTIVMFKIIYQCKTILKILLALHKYKTISS